MRHSVELTPDHPGFADLRYRARREHIAEKARQAACTQTVPDIDYTQTEHALWAALWRQLMPLHAAVACTPLLRVAQPSPLPQDRIPQLREISDWLKPRTGFELRPVAGLVSAREFLTALAHGVFSCTQYIRHPSRPHYTPEPDLVHELFGHAAALAHPALAELNRLFGRAAQRADEPTLRQLERVYWYTLEFGLVYEPEGLKALGAGLLSSVQELRGVAGRGTAAKLRAWTLATVRGTPFQTDRPQDTLFVAPSFHYLLAETRTWLMQLADARAPLAPDAAASPPTRAAPGA